MSMYRLVVLGLALMLAGVTSAQEVEVKKNSEITLVMWSAKDCGYCTKWKGSLGGQGDLKKWHEFSQIKYTIVEKPFLDASFKESDFSENQKWIWEERMAAPNRKRSGLPVWSVYVDRIWISSSAGTNGWNERIFPLIKELVRKKQSAASAILPIFTAAVSVAETD